MATVYKKSRNVAASIYYHIKQELIEDGLTSWTILKGFKRAYTTQMPVIAIRNGTDIYNSAEIGSTRVVKNHTIFIDIFARDETEKFDVKDWLFDVVRDGCDFYEHTAETDGVIEKIVNGKLIVLNVREQEIKTGDEKSVYAEHDKHRYLLILTVTTGEVE